MILVIFCNINDATTDHFLAQKIAPAHTAPARNCFLFAKRQQLYLSELEMVGFAKGVMKQGFS